MQVRMQELSGAEIPENIVCDVFKKLYIIK